MRQDVRNRWRHAPLGLLGMVALVAAVESSLGRQADRFATTSALSAQLSGEAARREAPGRSVLFFGDSLAKHGLIPSVFERAAGLTAFNLATPGAQAPTTYFLLKRALDAGARPEAVVVDFKPFLLAARGKKGMQDWSQLLSVAELADLAWTSGDPALAAEAAIQGWLPSLRGRHEIRDAVSAALRGEAEALWPINRACRRNWSLNQGANVAEINPAFTGAVSPNVAEHLSSNRWACRKLNARYVERFLDLAESRGIRVYWLLPPSCPELEALRDATGSERKFREYVRSVEARHPRLTVLDGREPSWVASLFVDSSHLDGRGGVALTLAVAGAMRNPEARPGAEWVALRVGDDARSVPLPETIRGSQVAISRIDAARR